LTALHAILIGLIEGFTEYLPVSANAHVIILGNLLHENAELVRSFAVTLQAAPALAVLFLFRRRFDALLRPQHAGSTTFKGVHAWILMALVTLPVLVAGLLFKKYFYGLMLSPIPSVAGLALGGVAILWAERHVQGRETIGIESVSEAQALCVGLFQCLALWPGVSRSGATIIGALLLGLDRKAAVEFSFFAGVPVFLAASALELHKSAWIRAEPLAFGLSFAVSLGIALLTVVAFMRLVGKISFRPFGWYRLALSPLLYFFFSV